MTQNQKRFQKDTINFVSYYYTRYVFSVIPKFFVPFCQILVCHFSCDIENLPMKNTVSGYFLGKNITFSLLARRWKGEGVRGEGEG